MQTAEPTDLAMTPDTDLTANIRRVLEESPEPLTLSKIRSALPAKLRSLSLEELAENLNRQVSANVLLQYPKYRSQQDRYWDRPMRDHIVYLLKTALTENPLALSELRRKLPDYAKNQAEEVLMEEVNRGLLHRHPPQSARGGPRFGVESPNPTTYLREELTVAFARLEKLGFTQSQLRQSALELLHEEEWATVPSETPVMTETPVMNEMPMNEIQPS